MLTSSRDWFGRRSSQDEWRGRAAGGDAGGSAGVPKGMIAPATWPARRQWRRCDHEPDASSSWRGHFLRSLARTGARGRCAATSAFLITDRSGHGSLLGRRVAAVSLLLGEPRSISAGEARRLAI